MQEKETIKSSAELRKFLVDACVDVRYGHLKVDKAQAVAKLAAQVNESLKLEIMAFQMLTSIGQGDQKIGALPLTIEAK